MKFLKIFLACLVLMVLLATGAGVGVYYWAQEDLPGFTRLSDYSPALATTVRARDGRILGYFYREKRFLVPLSMMSPITIKAFLAAEDAAFYQHEGVDPMAVLRALLANLRAGGIKQGGSTITQQIVKQLLLTPEKSYARKLKEALLAYRLERFLTKDEILTIYLNQIYLGSGAYGVEAAARIYFGKHADQLTLAEAAMLGGLPQAPSSHNPYQHMDSALHRQKYVLTRMLESGFITQAQFDAALRQKILLRSMTDPSWGVGAYYLEEVRRQLVERFGEKRVYEGGLHVHTAVDLDHQAAAEAALRTGAGLVSLATRPEHVGAVLATRPEVMVCGVLGAAELEPLLARADAVAIGPGLGRSAWGRTLFAAVARSGLPLVLDADALALLEDAPLTGADRVLTPHPGEAAGLLGCDVASVEADRYAALARLIDAAEGVVVLKGAGSLVGAAGELPVVVADGNAGMAVGGMGDVLTGVIGALRVQGLPAFRAAVAGALLHAAAGDLAAGSTPRGLLPSDLFPCLRQLVNPPAPGAPHEPV